jgi:hypothetical protein
MSKVMTTHGLIERDQLLVKIVITESDNARVTATEWYLGEGPDAELVRRDVAVSVLRAHEIAADAGAVG